MPQIFSRMDSANWLTPSISDVLDQGAAQPGGDGSIRERMLIIQQELDDYETPARIVNVRSMPSYTMYVARPGTVGRLGNTRTVTPNEIRRSISQIAENHKDWLLGFLPQLQDATDAVGIILRTADHRPQSLRRLLVRSTFRNHEETSAFTLGITLEQQLIVRDLATIKHLLVVGSNKAKQHFIRSLLLTLTLLNTPGELRIAIAGQSSEVYKGLVNTPHALGRLLVHAIDAQRLFDGMVKEVQRREQMFDEADVQTLDEYNQLLREQGKTEFPRIILLVDSLSDPGWQQTQEHWAAALGDLVQLGAKYGIHLVLTMSELNDPHVPEYLTEHIDTNVVMRSVAGDIPKNIENFHPSLLRFVDAFIVEPGDSEIGYNAYPVELCAISNQEIQSAVKYWKDAAQLRYTQNQMGPTGSAGLTDILKPPTREDQEKALPPVPDKPSLAALARATQVLASITGSSTATVTENNNHHPAPAPDLIADEDEDFKIIVKQSKALAAYLGWLGIGPLHDIFGLSVEDAHAVLNKLRQEQILENSDTPTPRYLRLLQIEPMVELE